MVFVYTAMGVLCVEHANVLELCYIELLSGDSSPYSILSVSTIDVNTLPAKQETVCPIYYLVPLCKSGSHSVMRQELRHANM